MRNRISKTPGPVSGPGAGATAPNYAYNVLVLYNSRSIFTSCVNDHLMSLKLFTGFNVYFADAVFESRCHYDLELFDAVVIHYTCCLYIDDYIHRSFRDKLASYSGPIFAFTQDEYDTTATIHRHIRDLGIDVYLTCVAPENIPLVFPPDQFPGTSFLNTLTGFVPLTIGKPETLRPVAERTVMIGYRARELHWKYGELARDKLMIGVRMKEACDARGIACDIAWTDDARIYWNRWSEFLESCRAVLGTESGFNVFDFDGSIRARVEEARRREPELTYEQVHERFLAEHEGRFGRMNQVSPRVFEAIAHKTALIQYEGTYSGVVEPHRHYIPLKKDFSNVDEVLGTLADTPAVEAMVERAYEDVILSGRYSHQRFAADFAELVRPRLGPPRGVVMYSQVYAALPGERHWSVASAQSTLESLRRFTDQCVRLDAAVAEGEGGGDGRARLVTGEPIYSMEEDALCDLTVAGHIVPILYDLAEIDSARPAIIFGTATGARLLFDELAVERPDLRLLGFIDHQLSGQLFGLPVSALDDLGDRVPRDATVILSNRYVRRSARSLIDAGFRHILNALPLVRHMAALKGF